MTNHFRPGDGTIPRARTLRKQSTEPERRLWAVLRGSQVNGHKFRRQQRLGPYFVDFCCMQARLVVELDGESHAEAVAYDQKRTAFLAQEGLRVIRFLNADVMGNLDGVCVAILMALDPSPSHPTLSGGPPPLPRGEREG